MADLKTNYKDRLLDTSVNTERKFNLVDSDGNVIVSGVSLRDITQYSQAGDTFGAADVNKITTEINGINNNLTAEDGSAFRYGYDAGTGKYGHWVKEADTDVFVPFRGKYHVVSYTFSGSSGSSGYYTETVTAKSLGYTKFIGIKTVTPYSNNNNVMKPRSLTCTLTNNDTEYILLANSSSNVNGSYTVEFICE